MLHIQGSSSEVGKMSPIILLLMFWTDSAFLGMGQVASEERLGDTARGRGCAQEAGARGVQEAVERHSAPWIWPLVIQMSHFGRCFCD